MWPEQLRGLLRWETLLAGEWGAQTQGWLTRKKTKHTDALARS